MASYASLPFITSDILFIDELNSFMYQSAAHNVVPYLAECFEVPLLRRKILGTSTIQTLEYSPPSPSSCVAEYDDHDEVEDLFEVIKQAILEFPSIEGVCSGAIVSSYQRHRVENVCSRLNLTSLTYLWQRDRNALLPEMLQAGIEAILVKVAGAGLEPAKHLGKDLHSLLPTLTKLHEKYGLDVCGEGGEYESLVLDCPLFRSKKIELGETLVVLDQEDISVGNLRILSCRCVEKEENAFFTTSSHEKVDKDVANGFRRELSSKEDTLLLPLEAEKSLPLVFFFRHQGIAQSPLLIPTPLILPISSSPHDNDEFIIHKAACSQLCSILTALEHHIKTSFPSCALRDAAFLHLYLSSNALFAAVNETYSSFFHSNPPSRSCMTAPLPTGAHVALDILLLLPPYYPLDRKVPYVPLSSFSLLFARM